MAAELVYRIEKLGQRIEADITLNGSKSGALSATVTRATLDGLELFGEAKAVADREVASMLHEYYGQPWTQAGSTFELTTPGVRWLPTG